MANWRSMKPVAAEAPTGNHQVLATKKYVLTRVITQINSSNARPIPQSSHDERRYERISPRRLPCPTTQATVGGECTTAARQNSKRVIEESYPGKLATDSHGFTRILKVRPGSP